MNIKDKNIILGVTGGIAAYKACELTRLFVKLGAHVFPVLTRAATKFVTPLTFSTLSGNAASHRLFPREREIAQANPGQNPTQNVSHIDITDIADVMVIAPATANYIGKVASGIADDLLTTITMACDAPKIIAPAMNHRMYENPVVQGNIEKLKRLGFIFVGPGEGELACGWDGKGRLAPLDDIVESVMKSLTVQDLTGEKLLVTAGATREPIDPVRFVSNASSGRMGYEIAKAATRRGAEVVLVTGQTAFPDPPGVTVVHVENAEELRCEASAYFQTSTVVVMTAAVSDFRPLYIQAKKMKKAEGVLSLELELTPDILREMGEKKEGRILVGFALETDNATENAIKKLREKNLDMVVVNSPAAIDSKDNEVTVIDSEERCESLPSMPKSELADLLLDRVVKIRD